MSWSPQEVMKLRALATQKMSAAVIAKELGRTRNEVSGKCFRERIKLFGNSAGAKRIGAENPWEKECGHCCERAAELYERVLQLEAQLYNREWEPPAEFRLSPIKKAILQALVATGRPVLADTMLDITRRCAFSKGEDICIKTITVHIFQLRAILKPFGLEIVTLYGEGYRIDPKSRAILLNWQTAEAA